MRVSIFVAGLITLVMPGPVKNPCEPTGDQSSMVGPCLVRGV